MRSPRGGASACRALVWKLLDFGPIRANIAASDARADAAVASYERPVLAALEETEGAFINYTRSQQQAASLYYAVAASEQAALIACERCRTRPAGAGAVRRGSITGCGLQGARRWLGRPLNSGQSLPADVDRPAGHVGQQNHGCAARPVDGCGQRGAGGGG